MKTQDELYNNLFFYLNHNHLFQDKIAILAKLDDVLFV